MFFDTTGSMGKPSPTSKRVALPKPTNGKPRSMPTPGYVFRNVLMGRYLSYKLQEEHGLVILDTNTPTKWDVVPVGDNVHHTIRVPSNPLNLTLSVMPYMQSLPLPVGKLEKYAKASNQHFVFYLVKAT